MRILPLAIALGLAGCSFEVPERALDVAASIRLPESVAFGEPVEIVFRWDPGDSFETPTADYLVFVHILDPEGEVFMQDDHEPPVPTSQWRAEETQEFQRYFRLPRSTQLDYIDVRVGLYDGGGRVAVRWGNEWETDSPLHRLYFTDQGYRGYPRPGEGWHELQRSRRNGEVWHWTHEAATAYFDNPRQAVVLNLEAKSPVDVIAGPQEVRLLLNGAEIASLTITDDARFKETIPLTSEALGSGDFVEVRIEVNPVQIPAAADPEADPDAGPGSSDDAVRGLQVFDLYLTER